MKKIIYLDTSGLRFLSDLYQDHELLSDVKQRFNFELYISDITLWEVLLNSNECQREHTIYWAQRNCSGRMLKSPSEIIFNFLSNGCPRKDRRGFFENPFSNNDIAIAWNSIHGKVNRTIPVDLEELKERTKPLRSLSKNFKPIIHGMVYGENQNDLFNEWMLELSRNLDNKRAIDKEKEALIKASLVIGLFISCIGIELQNNEVRQYWSEKEIDDPIERMDYLIKGSPEFFFSWSTYRDGNYGYYSNIHDKLKKSRLISGLLAYNLLLLFAPIDYRRRAF